MEYSKRINELAQRSQTRKRYEYTDFLNEREQADILRQNHKSEISVSMFGGAEFVQRKIVRFGNVNEIGYEEEYPVKILKITTTGGKFYEEMTHRDVLGAIMSLGVERSKVGDIFVSQNTAYAVICETVFRHISQSLNKVGGNCVKTEETKTVPDVFAPKTEKVKIVASSNRLDAILGKVFNLSRDKACYLISSERAFVNGSSVTKASKELSFGDVVSARGYGKFKFAGACGESRKGKTYFEIELYV